MHHSAPIQIKIESDKWNFIYCLVSVAQSESITRFAGAKGNENLSVPWVLPLSPRQIKELRGAPRSVKTVHSTKLRQQNLLGSNYISVLFVTLAHLELFYLNVNFNVSAFRDLFLRAISHFNTRILRHTTSAVVLTL